MAALAAPFGPALAQTDAELEAADAGEPAPALRSPVLVLPDGSDVRPADAPAAAPAPGGDRPAAAARVVRSFGFEHPVSDALPLPAEWYRAQNDPGVPRSRPGFPLWNDASVERGAGRGGSAAVRLDVRGGSNALALRGGVIGVFGSADYLVTGAVRGRGLINARPQIAAWLTDQDGRRIDGSAVETQPLPLDPELEWNPLAVAVPGGFDDAAFLELELRLLQPSEFRDRPEGTDPGLDADLDVWREDLNAAVWFDDVAVLQTPRVDVWTDAPGNVTVAPQRPRVSAFVSDLTGEPLTVEFTLHDISGAVVAAHREAFPGGKLETSWTPPVDRLGWYRAIALVRGARGVVGRGAVDLVWAAPAVAGALGRPSPDRARFELEFSELPGGGALALLDALRDAGSGSVVLPLLARPAPGESAIDDPDARVAAVRPLVAGLQAQGIDPVLAVHALPTLVAERAGVDPDDPLGLVAAGPAPAAQPPAWDPVLGPALRRFGQSVRRWRLGPPGSVGPAVNRDLAAQLDRAEAAVGRLVPGPVIEIPWRAEVPLGPARDGGAIAQGRGLAVALGRASVPHALAEITDAWRDAASRVAAGPPARRPSLSVAFESTPRPGVGLRDGPAELARDAVEFWRAAVSADPAPTPDSTRSQTPGSPADLAPAPFSNARAALRDPWRWSSARRPQLMPTPAYAAWRAVADRLVDRRVTAALDLRPGVTALLLEPTATAAETRGAVLAVWQSEPLDVGSGRAQAFEILLGLDPVHEVDIFGNRRELPVTLSGDNPARAHTVTAAREPRFYENVDAALLKFQAAVRIEPGMLVARPGDHEHEIVLDNPFDETVGGRVYIVEPGGLADERRAARLSWRIAPRAGDFAIAAGRDAALPFRVSFSPAEEAGLKAFVLDFDLHAQREYGLVRVTRFVPLGLPEAELTLAYRRAPDRDGPDVLVEARITNTGDRAETMELFVRADGYPRAKRTIPDLGPGESAVRNFPFADGIHTIRGGRVHVGLSLPESGGRIARSIQIGPAAAPGTDLIEPGR